MDPNVNLYDELYSFANKENRALHKKILEKNAELAKVNGEVTELQERLNVLQEHLKSVSNEVTSTQNLLTAKEAQAEEERHLQQLSEREYGKIVSELSRLEEETTKVQGKYSEVQAKTFKSQQRIEQFKEEEKLIRINAVIYVERDSQKGIIIGRGGKSLKKVGSEARKDLEAFFDKKIFLELFVKVEKDWRNKESKLKTFGYQLE